jgi:hypothetical protein
MNTNISNQNVPASYSPINPSDLVTKQYVDTILPPSSTGMNTDISNQDVPLTYFPTEENHLTTKSYVDGRTPTKFYEKYSDLGDITSLLDVILELPPEFDFTTFPDKNKTFLLFVKCVIFIDVGTITELAILLGQTIISVREISSNYQILGFGDGIGLKNMAMKIELTDTKIQLTLTGVVNDPQIIDQRKMIYTLQEL